MRERLNERCMNGEYRIEEVGEPDTVCFGYQPEEVAGSIETPRPPLFDYLDTLLIVTIEQLVGDIAGGILVGELEGIRPEPLHGHHFHEAVRKDASDGGVWPKIFQLTHVPKSLLFGWHTGAEGRGMWVDPVTF
jgi:hypothetical protein